MYELTLDEEWVREFAKSRACSKKGGPDEDEDLWEWFYNILGKEGKTVFSHLCLCSSGPGSAGYYVCKLNGLYFGQDETNWWTGPYEDLLDVLLNSFFLMLTDCASTIKCTEISAEELVEYLEPYDDAPVRINGFDWVL
jgi:hypothetical protein